MLPLTLAPAACSSVHGCGAGDEAGSPDDIHPIISSKAINRRAAGCHLAADPLLQQTSPSSGNGLPTAHSRPPASRRGI